MSELQTVLSAVGVRVELWLHPGSVQVSSESLSHYLLLSQKRLHGSS
jgi:hypothetical protein